MNYAGVTIDFYDDKGATVRARFPDPDSLPDFVKSANVMPQDDIPNEDFALVALNEGHVMRKFACNDKGTTAMSVMYLMEHGNKLPAEAIKMAAANLLVKCEEHGIEPPPALVKEAWKSLALGGALGGALGAGAGAATAKPGNRAKKAILGGLLGAGVGAAGGKMIAMDSALRNVGREAGRKASQTMAAGASATAGKAMKDMQAKHVQDAVSKIMKTGMVDITGKLPDPIIKHASPVSDDDWCVVMPDGTRHYPIDSYDNIKTAERFFLDNSRRMEPEIRRQYAVKLAAKCQTVGYQVDGKVKEAGAVTAAPDGHLKMAMQARKLYSDDGALLDEVFEKRAELGPEMTAQILNRYDYQHGLDRLWDTTIPDPWASTYTLQKTADEVVWQEGADRVTRGQLENLVMNRLELVEKEFSDQIATGLHKDPVGVFKSLPLPHKKILARLAADTSADGSSEYDPESPEAGEHKAE